MDESEGNRERETERQRDNRLMHTGTPTRRSGAYRSAPGNPPPPHLHLFSPCILSVHYLHLFSLFILFISSSIHRSCLFSPYVFSRFLLSTSSLYFLSPSLSISSLRRLYLISLFSSLSLLYLSLHLFSPCLPSSLSIIYSLNLLSCTFSL